jgi:formaldehyde-activating enzyme involved in methanogenesis
MKINHYAFLRLLNVLLPNVKMHLTTLTVRQTKMRKLHAHAVAFLFVAVVVLLDTFDSVTRKIIPKLFWTHILDPRCHSIYI